MKPPIPLGHLPLLVLLTVAAAVCQLLIAELRGRLTMLPKTASVRQRLAASLGSLFVMVLASAALFLIGGFIGLGFGPFYLIICAVTALLVIFTALGIPRVSRTFERLSTGQLTGRATAVIVACLVLAVLYEVAANHYGLALHVGPAAG